MACAAARTVTCALQQVKKDLHGKTLMITPHMIQTIIRGPGHISLSLAFTFTHRSTVTQPIRHVSSSRGLLT